MNGPKAKLKPAWRWELLPQEGLFHLVILRIAQGDRAFLAYSGVGDGIKCSDLTNEAIRRMTPLAGGKVVMDLRKSLKPADRVRSACDNAEDDSIVIFWSPNDSAAAAINKVIFSGKRMDPA